MRAIFPRLSGTDSSPRRRVVHGAGPPGPDGYQALETRRLLAVTWVPDGLNKTFTLTGDTAGQTVIVLDTPGVTSSINIDTDGDGALDVFLDSQLFFGIPEFDHYVFHMAGGNDRVEFRLMNHLSDGERELKVWGGETGGLNLLVDANGSDIRRSDFSVRMNGTPGNDFFQGEFNGIYGSDVDVNVTFRDGADQMYYLLRGTILNSSFDSYMSGAKGVDTENVFVQRQALIDNSDLSFVADTHSGNDAISVSINSSDIRNGSTMRYVANAHGDNDALNYRLNAGVSTGSSVELKGSLGSGNDALVSTLGYDNFVNDATSRASFTVNGGSGDDSFLVMPFTLQGKDAILNGEVQYSLNGNAGNDTFNFLTQDQFGRTLANLRLGATGRYQVEVNGDSGDDTINAVVDLDAGSSASGQFHGRFRGGSGADRISYYGSDLAGVNYGPKKKIVINGNTGDDVFSLLFNDPQGETPLLLLGF